MREHATEGSPGDKFFLLHQSIDLNELYHVVPVAQIVTRGKLFFTKDKPLRFVHQYNIYTPSWGVSITPYHSVECKTDSFTKWMTM